MQQLPLPVMLRASSVFESFYSGPNDAVVRQLLGLQPSGKPTAIWLYGSAGVGKTHLLQALCARSQPRNSATYLPLRELQPLHPDWLQGCEVLSWVCIDDIETVLGQADWERALFRLYNELEEAGGHLVIAATVPPGSARIALADLASRLSAGWVLPLCPLDDEQQQAALQARAKQLGLDLPTDTAQFLLRRLPRDMATLCSTLERLDEASLITQRRLTLPFVREWLDRSADRLASGL
jgi:DnaA family protein